MKIHLLDLFIVFGFLIFTLILGVYRGFGIKTVKEYAIGSGKIATLALMGTLIASDIGGYSTIELSQRTFSVGIVVPLLVSAGLILSNIIIAYCIAPRISNFKRKMSAGEVMQNAYGKFGRMITGLFSFLLCLGILGVQISAMGYIFSLFIGISHTWGVIIGFGITILYSAFGGIRSVTFTDAFQVIMIIAVIPIIAAEGLKQVGMLPELIYFIKKDYPLHFSLFGNLNLIRKDIFCAIFFAIPVIFPTTVQRLLMANKASQLKKSFILLSVMRIVLSIAIVIIGLSTLKLNPNLDPHLSFPYLIQTVFPIGLKGFAMAGVLAIMMSSADSFLNTGVIAIVHDCIKPICGRKLSANLELKLMRIATLVMGLISIIISINFDSLTSIYINTGLFWCVTITPSLIGQLVGYRTSKKRFFLAMIGSVLCMLYCRMLIAKEYHFGVFLPAILCNTFIAFGPKAIVRVAIHFVCEIVAVILKSALSLFLFVTKIPVRTCQVLLKIRTFYNKTTVHYGNTSIIFPIFMVLNVIIPFFIWEAKCLHLDAWITIRGIAAACCTILIFKEKTPYKFLKYWNLFYHFTIMFSLTFMSTFTIFDTSGDIYALLNATVSLLMLVLLVDWKNFLILTFIGVFAGCGVFYMVNAYEPIVPSFQIPQSDWHIFIYTTILMLMVGFVFSRRKLEQQEALIQAAESRASVIANELRISLITMAKKAKIVKRNITSLENVNANNAINIEFAAKHLSFSKNLIDSHQKVATQVDKLIGIILNNVKTQENINTRLFIVLSIQKCIEEAIATFPYANYDKDRSKVHIVIKNEFRFYGIKELVVHIIYNLLKNAFKAISIANKGEIFVYTKTKFDRNYLIIEDTALGMPQHQLSNITEKFTSFWVCGTGLGLAFCKSAMQAMGGYMEIEAKENFFTRITLGFPALKEN